MSILSKILGNKKCIFVILSSMIMCYSHIFLENDEATIFVGLILISLCLDLMLPLCLYLCSIVIQVDIPRTLEYSLFVFLTFASLVTYLKYKHNEKVINYNKLCISIIIVVILSTLQSAIFGYTQGIMTGVMMVFQIIYVLSLISSVYNNEYSSIVKAAFISSGLMVGLYVYYLVITGNASYIMTTLVYGDEENLGNVKALSTSVAIPVYFCLYNILFKKEKYGKIMIPIEICVVLLCLYIIILTYSRGVLLAIMVSFFYLLSKYFKNISISQMVLGAALVLVLSYVIINIDFDTDKMFDKLEGGHGRTDIWKYIFSKQVDGVFLTILFGFGPGDIKRITAGSAYDGYYTHSVFLDYLFVYGVLGFIVFIKLVYKTLINLFKNNNIEYCGLLILLIIMYFPHGSAYNLPFHMLLALCVGYSVKNNIVTCNK